MATKAFQFFATTPLGMEKLLFEEIQTFKPSEIREDRGGVAFAGPLELGYRVCLWSRVASRVLLFLEGFPAFTPEQLYSGVRRIDWSDHMSVSNTLAVDFTSSRSKIQHTQYGALKVKDAIVDQFRSRCGERPSVDIRNPDLRVNVYVHDNQAVVSLDLSGESLHKRGYRAAGAQAPLKENLAAAILGLMKWPREESSALMDPMCGSGTLPIESALASARIAPGLGRPSFGFMKWLGHVPILWKRLLEEAQDLQIRDPKRLPKIVGYDEDARAVRVAIENVERAGLRARVHIEKRTLAACTPVALQGLIVLNPPYGERLGESADLVGLYRQIGDQFKQNFKGWEGYVFTGNKDLSKQVGLKATERWSLYNGAMECKLLKYDLY